MSKTYEELETEEAMWSDASTFISKRDFRQARMIMQNAGDLGYESVALKIHKAINSAETPFERQSEIYDFLFNLGRKSV